MGHLEDEAAGKTELWEPAGNLAFAPAAGNKLATVCGGSFGSLCEAAEYDTSSMLQIGSAYHGLEAL